MQVVYALVGCSSADDFCVCTALVAADEQRPANVIAFVRDQLVETDPEMTQLLQENHDQKRRIEELTRQLNEVNAKLA